MKLFFADVLQPKSSLHYVNITGPRIDHLMVSCLNILQDIFTFVTINSPFTCSQALLFESLQDCLPHKFLLVLVLNVFAHNRFVFEF